MKNNMQEYQFTYSFIIPHHNSPELLNRCLDSIPQREDIQIIVVDDNSAEDKCPCIKRDDVEVIYIDAEHTKGAGRARNYGLKAAKGKWLLFADCDDYYNAGFLDVLDQYKDKDIEVLYFNYYFIDGKDGFMLSDNNLQKNIISYDGSKEKTDYIKYRNNTPWTKMVSHDFVIRIEAFFEEVTNGNDVLFSLWIGNKAKYIAVSKVRLYSYIKTQNSIGTKKQSVNDLMCRLTHIVKHNAFNNALGFHKWNGNSFVFVVAQIKRMGIKRIFEFIYTILISTPNMIYHRNEWVSLILNKKI